MRIVIPKYLFVLSAAFICSGSLFAQQKADDYALAKGWISEPIIHLKTIAIPTPKKMGDTIVRELLSNKINHPELVSKKEYLNNPYLSEHNLNYVKQTLENLERLEFRKQVYTLVPSDSIFYGCDNFTYRITALDTSIGNNSFYRFYTFDVQTINYQLGVRYQSSGPYGAQSPIAKPNAFIYDSRFTVGVPKVCILRADSSKGILPYLFFGRDFANRKQSTELLASILKRNYIADTLIQKTLIQIDAAGDYEPEKPAFFSQNKSSVQFSFFSKARKLRYIASIDQNYAISYQLVETSDNLLGFVFSVYDAQFPFLYPEIKFLNQRRKRFAYLVTPKEGNPKIATYKKGKITFTENTSRH
jgi:hypothetical protein